MKSRADVTAQATTTKEIRRKQQNAAGYVFVFICVCICVSLGGGERPTDLVEGGALRLHDPLAQAGRLLSQRVHLREEAAVAADEGLDLALDRRGELAHLHER